MWLFCNWENRDKESGFQKAGIFKVLLWSGSTVTAGSKVCFSYVSLKSLLKSLPKCSPFIRCLNSHPQVVSAHKPLWTQRHACLPIAYENQTILIYLFLDSTTWSSGHARAMEGICVRFWMRYRVFRAIFCSWILWTSLHLLSWDSYPLMGSTLWTLWFLQVHSNYVWHSQICRFLRPGVHPFLTHYPLHSAQ